MTACNNAPSATQNAVQNNYEAPYSLNAPSKKYHLPDALDEISGIAHFDKNTIAAIQDEKGKIYFYNLNEEDIEHKIDFGKGKDYESLDIHNSKASILSSDGKLFQFKIDRAIKEVDANSININSKTTKNAEIEGFCHWKKNSYLVAFKQRTNADDATERSIFVYENGQLSEKPLFQFNNKNFRSYLASLSNLPNKLESFKKNLNPIKASFYPSDIAVHPKSKDIYVLSAVNELLVIVDGKNYKIKHMHSFKNEDLPQPEGICFSPNGDMFIASEKNNAKHAKLYFFESLATE